MNMIHITGFINKVKYDGRKTGKETDKGFLLAFTVSSKAGQYRRNQATGAEGRDFFDVETFIPSRVSKFADYLTPGKQINLAGVPTFNIGTDGKRYFIIVAESCHISFVERNTNEGNSNSQSSDRHISQDERNEQGQSEGF